jgi:acyl-coenzyme A thioesterase PaaI-like protein
VALTTDPDGVRRTRFVTVSFSLNFLAPFRDGEVTCEARVVGGGRKLKTVETRVIGPDGETLLATGHGVFRRIQ